MCCKSIKIQKAVAYLWKIGHFNCLLSVNQFAQIAAVGILHDDADQGNISLKKTQLQLRTKIVDESGPQVN